MSTVLESVLRGESHCKRWVDRGKLLVRDQSIIGVITLLTFTLVPVQFYMELVDGPGHSGLGIYVTDYLFVVLAIIVLTRSESLTIRDSRSAQLAVCGFGAVALWSVVSAPYAIRSPVAAMMYAVDQSRYLLYFAVTAVLVSSENRRSIVTAMMIGIGIVLAVRAAGYQFAHIRHMTGVILFGVPLYLSAISDGGWVRKTAGIGGASGCLAVIAESNTDAGWYALLIVLALWLAYYFRIHRDWYLPVAFSGALAAASGWAYRDRLLSPGLIPAHLDTLSSRVSQYRMALDYALEYPVTGIGGYNFALLYGDVGVHNLIFSQLAALGWIGLCASLTCWLGVSWHTCRSLGEDIFQSDIVAVSIALVGLIAYGCWNLLAVQPQPNFVLSAGAGILIGESIGFE